VLGATLLAAAGTARADADLGVGPKPTAKPTMTLRGYGELQGAFYAYGADQSREGGAQRDRRLEFDTTRLVTELELMFPGQLEVEAEVEFEHGGTGAAFELEYDEFGEYEKEIEKGGEVIVEELYLRKTFAGRYAVSAGRFYVAVGTLSRYYRPTSYLGTTRSEAEQTVIPAQWDEMGVQGEAFLGAWKLTAQIVNGLDSSAFSSGRWVASGHQARFETIRATDLAVAVRADVQPIAGLEVGWSGYAGGTSRNRPKPDLVPDCMDPTPRAVAPCGYVNAPLFITDLHAALDLSGIRANGMVLFGHLERAAEISTRNERLSNEADVDRTPVSDNALAVWAEVGYDVAPALLLEPKHRIEPFVRVEHYDTVFQPRDELFDNPRYARTIGSLGVAYQFHGSVTAKVDVFRRTFASDELRPEHGARLAGGFVF
jgi:hypothetical protein